MGQLARKQMNGTFYGFVDDAYLSKRVALAG